MSRRIDKICGRDSILEITLSGRIGKGKAMSKSYHPIKRPTALIIFSSYYQGGSFPISKEGRLKFGFRGRKVGNNSGYQSIAALIIGPEIHSSPIFKTIPLNQICRYIIASLVALIAEFYSRISTPRTRYSKDPIKTVPLYGLSRMKEVIAEALPELAEFGFTESRVCIYS